MGFGGGALGSLVLFLVKSVLVGITLSSHTKKKLKIGGGVLKPCLLPDAHLLTSATCFLSEVWPHILGGVSGAHGGNGGDWKFGALLGSYTWSASAYQCGQALPQVMGFYGHRKFPKEHVPRGPHECEGLHTHGIRATLAFRLIGAAHF